MMDQTTRWPEIISLSSISAASCPQALLSVWVSRFGVPSVLTSDLGTQVHLLLVERILPAS